MLPISPISPRCCPYLPYLPDVAHITQATFLDVAWVTGGISCIRTCPVWTTRLFFVCILYCPWQAPTPQFWLFCIFAIVLMHFGCHDIRHQRFAHTRPWPCCSILPLQCEIHMLAVTTECCGNLATRLRVGPLCSMIWLSLLSGWPRRSTDEPTMQVDSVPWHLQM